LFSPPDTLFTTGGEKMFNRKRVLTAVVGLTLAVLVAASAYAWNTRMSYVTFSGTVALPEAVLPAGTYTFELPETSNLDVVRVLSKDRSKVYFLGFTRATPRPFQMDPNRVTVTLGEAERGVPPPVATWYPIGSSIGHTFIYQNGR
jgi:hypothetical protein